MTDKQARWRWTVENHRQIDNFTRTVALSADDAHGWLDADKFAETHGCTTQDVHRALTELAGLNLVTVDPADGWTYRHYGAAARSRDAA